MTPARAVSFDFGQTLAALDTAMLAGRLAERGLAVAADALEAATPAAWRAYNAAIVPGASGHPWKTLMARLLELAGVADPERAAAVDWLWDEQPRKNLWRRPVPGMIELVRDLGAAGVPVAVLSNSEGKLAELATELGWAHLFVAIADSGKLGIEKPARAIFEWTAERLGVALADVIHVGDSRQADVEGALRAGMRAIWFEGDPSFVTDRARACADATEVREALAAWGLRSS